LPHFRIIIHCRLAVRCTDKTIIKIDISTWRLSWIRLIQRKALLIWILSIIDVLKTEAHMLGQLELLELPTSRPS
jgi:hypothetical protein